MGRWIVTQRERNQDKMVAGPWAIGWLILKGTVAGKMSLQELGNHEGTVPPGSVRS